jgi:hypothetical protein
LIKKTIGIYPLKKSQGVRGGRALSVFLNNGRVLTSKR